MDIQNKYGETVLYIAATLKSKEIVKLLLESGASVDIQNYNGTTALYLVVRFGWKEIVELLMNWGGNPYIKNYNGKIAIDCAKTEEIRELLRNQKVPALERKMLNYVQMNREILRKEIRKDMLIEKYFLIFGRK